MKIIFGVLRFILGTKNFKNVGNFLNIKKHFKLFILIFLLFLLFAFKNCFPICICYMTDENA